MRLPKSAIFILVLFALGAFYYFYVYKGDQRKKSAEEAARKVWLVKADDIEEMLIRSQGQEVRLIREGSDFKMVAPVRAEADSRVVKGLIELLIRAEKARTLTETPEGLAAYGLEGPGLEVALKPKGKKAVSLAFGHATLDGRGVFGRVVGRRGVFILPVEFKRIADRTPYDLRDKKVLTLDKEKVHRLEVFTGRVKLVVEKSPQGDWLMKEPIETPAGGEEINNLLNMLAQMKAAGFEPARRDLKTKPVRWLKLWEQGKESPASLIVGGQDKRGRFYAQVEGRDELILLDRSSFEALQDSPLDLREKSPLVFEVPKAAQKIELSSQGKRLTVERRQKGWQIINPKKWPAAEVRVNAWLWRIRELKAKELIDSYPGLAPFGLDRPQSTLTVWTENRGPQTLLLGSRKRNGYVFVKRGDSPAIYVVRDKDVQAFRRTAEDIQDRRLFPFEDKLFYEIRMQHNGFKTVLRREKERWDVIEPSPRDLVVEPMRAWTLFRSLRDVEFEKVVADKVADLAPYGLERPLASVEIKDRQGMTVARLKIGKVTGRPSKYYGMLEDKPTIFSLERDVLERVPASEVEL